MTLFNKTQSAVAALVAIVGVGHASAAVLLTEDQSVADWPNSGPVISTAGEQDPDYGNSGVGFVSTTGTATIGQTFTTTDGFSLGKIDLAYATGAAQQVGFRIYQVDVTENETNYTYAATPSTSALLDVTLSLAVDTDGAKVLTIELTDSDVVELVADTVYVMEFYELEQTTTFSLRRRGSSLYAGGAVFSNGESVNGTATRDALTRLYAVPEPGALVLTGLGGLMLLPRRGASDHGGPDR